MTAFPTDRSIRVAALGIEGVWRVEHLLGRLGLTRLAAGTYVWHIVRDLVDEGLLERRSDGYAAPGPYRRSRLSGRRVIVCGSRGWHDRQAVQDVLADLGEEFGCDLTIVVGYDTVKDKPRGADRIAYQEAQKHGFRVETYPADDFIESGKISGKVAPLERNKHMAALGADLCVAFWDGLSTGTAHMKDRAREAGIPVRTIGVRSRLDSGKDGAA